MTSEASIEVRPEDGDNVRIRLDRPGVSAVSYVGDAEELIRYICAAAGFEVEDFTNGLGITFPDGDDEESLV